MEADGAAHLWILLIVSDLPRLRRLKHQLPEAGGMRSIVARSLLDGGRLLRAHPIDVVVADLSLPDGQGLAVVHRLRSWAPRLPLVVLSEDSRELSIQALQAGAQDYLSLSGGHRTLRESVRYALERKQAEEEQRASVRLEASEIVSLRGGRWGHHVRGGGDPLLQIRAALVALPAGRVLVSAPAAWLVTPGGLEQLAVLRGAERVVLGVEEVSLAARSASARAGLERFRALGGQVFAMGVGERPLVELVSMPLDGLVLALSVCALAQERRGAPLVRAAVSLAEECGWVVLGTGESLRFLGCRLIHRAEWSGLQ